MPDVQRRLTGSIPGLGKKKFFFFKILGPSNQLPFQRYPQISITTFSSLRSFGGTAEKVVEISVCVVYKNLKMM